LFVLYTFQKDTIKDRIIKHVKAKKRRKYGQFSISRHVKKSEKFNSIPVRVTINWLLQMAILSHLQFFIILTNYP